MLMYFRRDTKRRQVDDVSGRDDCDGPSLLTVFSLQSPIDDSSTLEFIQRYVSTVITLIKKINPSF